MDALPYGNNGPYRAYDLDFDENLTLIDPGLMEEIAGSHNLDLSEHTGGRYSDLPIPPPPPALEAQLDEFGNWYYPDTDQANRNLRIQCEAFRAGAASRPGLAHSLGIGSDETPILSTPMPRKASKTTVDKRYKMPIKLGKGRLAKDNRKRASFAQECVCYEANHAPKRPANAFLIFRRMLQPKIASAVRKGPPSLDKKGRQKPDMAAISTLAGQWWEDAKANGQAQYYFDLAEKEKLAHAQKFPGYNYTPRRKEILKWGNESCTCGAFQANEARERERKREAAGLALHEGNNFDYDEDDVQREEREMKQARATRKRRRSLSTLDGRSSERERDSTIANTVRNSDYAPEFDEDSSFLLTERYDADTTGENRQPRSIEYGTLQDTHEGGMDDNTISRDRPHAPLTYGGEVNFPAEFSPPAYGTRSRSRSRSSAFPRGIATFTQPDYGAAPLTDEDFAALLQQYQNNDGVDGHQLVDAANEEQAEEVDVPVRGSSLDSLFFDLRSSGSSARKRSSRTAISPRTAKSPRTPTTPSGVRRSLRLPQR